MKKALLLALLLTASVFAQKEDSGSTPNPARTFNRNTKPAVNAVQRLHSRGGTGGLAPSTWGFVSKYSGSLYGTGYYPFRVDLTYAGDNSIYGYTFNYPSNGFANDIKAIYAFDISGLSKSGTPLWSSFMFDVRERPAAGSAGLAAFANIELVTNGTTHTLEGLALFQGNNASHLDIYNAEEFENADPFANPDLAFTGSNPLITTQSVTTNVIETISQDVTAAVHNDMPLTVPTLGTYGLIAFVLFLIAAGVMVSRKRKLA